MFQFEELRVYQETLDIVDSLYECSKKFPHDEIFGLTNQLRRAAVSITLNIAERTSRTKKEFCHFLDMARGSYYECVAVLTICRNRKYISETDYLKYYDQCNKISRMISALKKSLQ